MMSNDTAIKVQNLTKIYHLYDKPQDRLKEALHPFKKLYHHDFYAMHDVSFQIKKGDTVGVIGKNGAGKSTLLKMITGVLTPTSGTIEINGKIASLLELGAGFNPEMTGLENIYLNGTLMGFSKEEMDTKVDSILEFADIGEFIYQPVKMYSSGMFARLAFSVAINVEPDILIVDEVLSVGDMRFQQKSLRKMNEMQKRGITILFVAHDMGAINTFCSRVVWINNGEVVEEGETDSISKKYISFMAYGMTKDDNNIKPNVSPNKNKVTQTISNKELTWITPEGSDSFGEGGAKIVSVSFCDDIKDPLNTLLHSQTVNFYVQFKAFQDLHSVALGLLLKDRLSNNIFTLNSYMYDEVIDFVKNGSINIANFSFEFPYLREGEYTFSVTISEGTQDNHIMHHWVHDICTIKYLSKEKTNKAATILAIDKKDVNITYQGIK